MSEHFGNFLERISNFFDAVVTKKWIKDGRNRRQTDKLQPYC